jgi:hypothetical protein
MENTNYERLFNFLGSWFPDMELEGETEESITREYKESVSSEEVQAMIFEAEAVLNEIEKHWKRIEHETNLYFEGSRQAYIWLKRIVEYLKR